jgi:enterochelin esterase-like enzyme
MKITSAVAVFVLTACGAFGQETPLTPELLRAELARTPSGTPADSLAERVRTFFGKDNLAKGAPPRIDGMTVAWGIEAPAPGAPPVVVSEDGKLRIPLRRIGKTDVWAEAGPLPDGTVARVAYDVGGKKGAPANLEVYRPHPDSLEKPEVPKGTVKQMPRWESRVFAGTSRDWWIYVPAQYRPEAPACVLVVQDGQNYIRSFPAMLDNLIARGDIPVLAAVFIPPGVFADGRSNRSFEYDTLSDQYVRFLLEEMLPEAEKTVRLRHDAASRAIFGISSGGICAFTAAWERPNEFSKVLSWVGSFTNIASGKTLREGGHNYPALIRKTPRKPIRVFLQDGENDLDNVHGSWPLANQQMARSLAFAGYDFTFVYGRGFHSNRHGLSILPDSLRWLWRDYKP